MFIRVCFQDAVSDVGLLGLLISALFIHSRIVKALGFNAMSLRAALAVNTVLL